jgi:hypothetical protein
VAVVGGMGFGNVKTDGDVAAGLLSRSIISSDTDAPMHAELPLWTRFRSVLGGIALSGAILR